MFDFNFTKIISYFSTIKIIDKNLQIRKRSKYTDAGEIKFICTNEEAFRKSLENLAINNENKAEFFKNEIESLTDGLNLILKRFVTSSIKSLIQFKVEDTQEFQLVETKEAEEEIFSGFNSMTKMYSIDFFLLKLQNIQIDDKDLSKYLLSKQYNNLKGTYIFKNKKDKKFIVSTDPTKTIATIKKRLQRLIYIELNIHMTIDKSDDYQASYLNVILSSKSNFLNHGTVNPC